MPPGDVLSHIQLGYKNQAWFDANPTLVLKEGQKVYLLQTGKYKIGDGTTALSGLQWLGVSAIGPNEVAFGEDPAGNITSSQLLKWDNQFSRLTIGQPAFDTQYFGLNNDGGIATEGSNYVFRINDPNAFFYTTVRGAAEGSNYGSPLGGGAIEFSTYGSSGIIFGNLNSKPIVFASGAIATDAATRIDTVGVRIGALSGIGASNNYKLEVGGLSLFTDTIYSFPSGSTPCFQGYQGIDSPYPAMYIHKASSSNIPIIRADRGTGATITPGLGYRAVFSFGLPDGVSQGSAIQDAALVSAEYLQNITAGVPSTRYTSVLIETMTAGVLAEKFRVTSYGIRALNLPTSSAGLVSGDIWNDSGTLKIV